MSDLAVTDSHALIWYAAKRKRRLGPKAKRFFARVDAGRAAVYIPTIALVEIAEASRNGIIRLEGGFSKWCARLLSSPRFIALDLTVEVVLEGEGLYRIAETGDRLIAATAAVLELPLITRDPGIVEDTGVEVIW